MEKNSEKVICKSVEESNNLLPLMSEFHINLPKPQRSIKLKQNHVLNTNSNFYGEESGGVISQRESAHKQTQQASQLTPKFTIDSNLQYSYSIQINAPSQTKNSSSSIIRSKEESKLFVFLDALEKIIRVISNQYQSNKHQAFVKLKHSEEEEVFQLLSKTSEVESQIHRNKNVESLLLKLQNQKEESPISMKTMNKARQFQMNQILKSFKNQFPSKESLPKSHEFDISADLSALILNQNKVKVTQQLNTSSSKNSSPQKKITKEEEIVGDWLPLQTRNRLDTSKKLSEQTNTHPIQQNIQNIQTLKKKTSIKQLPMESRKSLRRQSDLVRNGFSLDSKTSKIISYENDMKKHQAFNQILKLCPRNMPLPNSCKPTRNKMENIKPNNRHDISIKLIPENPQENSPFASNKVPNIKFEYPLHVTIHNTIIHTDHIVKEVIQRPERPRTSSSAPKITFSFWNRAEAKQIPLKIENVIGNYCPEEYYGSLNMQKDIRKDGTQEFTTNERELFKNKCYPNHTEKVMNVKKDTNYWIEALEQSRQNEQKHHKHQKMIQVMTPHHNDRPEATNHTNSVYFQQYYEPFIQKNHINALHRNDLSKKPRLLQKEEQNQHKNYNNYCKPPKMYPVQNDLIVENASKPNSPIIKLLNFPLSNGKASLPQSTTNRTNTFHTSNSQHEYFPADGNKEYVMRVRSPKANKIHVTANTPRGILHHT